LVDQAIEAAAQAPSACNRQPFAFRVFDDPELATQIALVPGGAAGFADGFTGLIVLVGDLSAFASERDRHLIYIDSSLAAMGFMLAAETLGFSTCPLNWPDNPGSERGLRRLMKLEPFERPIMLIAYGFPDTDAPVAASMKRPLSELRTYNEVE
jgi:nitroreductase